MPHRHVLTSVFLVFLLTFSVNSRSSDVLEADVKLVSGFENTNPLLQKELVNILSSRDRFREFQLIFDEYGTNGSFDIGSDWHKASSQQEVSYVKYEIAIRLSEIGFQAVKNKKWNTAEKAWNLATRFEPRHAPAWFGLSVLAVNSGNCTDAVSYADRVLKFDPKILLGDSVNETIALANSPAGEKLAAEGLGELELLNANTDMDNQLMEIRNSCT